MNDERLATARAAHLSAVGRAIRAVNKLLIRERAPETLLRRAAEVLVEARAFRAVAILRAEEGVVTRSFLEGQPEELASLQRTVGAGELPPCVLRALRGGEDGAHLRWPDECQGCPIGGERSTLRDAVAVPLQYDQQRFGALFAVFPEGVEADAAGVELLRELADDVALGLRNLELEASLRVGLEQRVAERTAELEDLYDNAPCGYHTLGPEGTILRINATELRWLGYTRAELLGRKFCELCTPRCAEQVQADIARLRATSKPSGWGAAERELVRKDGSILWALGTAVVNRDAEGCVTIRSTLVDITERKWAESLLREREAGLREALAEAGRANAALNRASHAKDEFLASMSHELRTPLNGILGLAEALQEGVYGPLTVRQVGSLGRVRESGQHLLALINDILDLAKVEAGKITLEPTPVHIEDLVRSSLRLVSESAQRKQLRVSAPPPSRPRSAPVLLDERRMKQVLVNLLSNAIKFTPAGGEIGIEATLRDDETLSFSVRDTGIGIASEDVARLFQPFVQLDSRLSRDHAGTGLGLSLVRRLVDLHGGTVDVESDLGRGSCFTLTLPARWPVRPTSAEVLPTSVRPAPCRDGFGELILLADDDEIHAEIVGRALKAEGFDVCTAGNGVEAVQLCRAQRPSLVLMDLQMPKMDGLAAIQAIRAEPDPVVSGVPIIAVTALAMSGDRERCLAAGASDYLVKPVSLRRLLGVIDGLLLPLATT